jgi:drug/metabolite transporter (DMT)-like permease
MTAVALALVLASAAIHASWNLWAKQLGPAARALTLTFALTAISACVYAPLAFGEMALTGWRPTAAALPWVVASGVIHVVYFQVLLRGYRTGDLSIVYPVARGTGPLLAAASAVMLFGERPTPLSVGGALLVATGVLTLTLRVGEAPAGRASRGVRWGLATGLLIAVYTLWDGWAVKRVGIPPLTYYWAGEVTRVVLLAPFALADRGGLAALWKNHRTRVAGIALLSPLSYILILFALRSGPVSHIAPARELSILIGTWLGGRVLGEGQRVRRALAAAAFAAGVIALALA